MIIFIQVTFMRKLYNCSNTYFQKFLTIEEYNKTVEFVSTIKKYATISPDNFTVM